jgi:VWFA-related protein
MHTSSDRGRARWAKVFVVAAILGLALARPATGQGAPEGPIHPKAGAQPEIINPNQEKSALKAQVTEVTAPVTVLNESGEMILNLTKENFHVFDNGTAQTIDHFDLGGDPLSIALVVETSSRIEPLLPAIRKTGVIFAETVMAMTSEAALITYDDTVDLQLKFTTDPDAVENAMTHLRTGFETERLYDAMARGIEMLSERPAVRRRILVVVGEAHDSGSGVRLGEVLRQAQLQNVTIYSIGLSSAAARLRAKPAEPEPVDIGPPGTYPVPLPPGTPPTPEAERNAQYGNADLVALGIYLVKTGLNSLGPNSLAIASKATGGSHLNTMRDRTIEKAMDAVGGELHSQYTIGYRPNGELASGFHEIKIVVDRPNVTVRTRPGYYIAPAVAQ